MNVLIGCEFSGIVREEFRKRGHNAWSCDLLPTEIPGKHIEADILNLLKKNWDLMIGFPPYTYLCSSGARWWKLNKKEQDRGIEFFMNLINAPIKKICVENPIGIMSTYYRKPDQIIQPWQFGHGETKATCLWLKNLPLLKPTKIVSGREHRIHKEPPSKERWKNRSRFYKGIASGMATQWG